MTATPQQPRGSLPLGILMGAVVGAIVLAIVWFGAGLGDSRTATPAASPSPSPTQTVPSPAQTTPSLEPASEETASEEPAPEEPAPEASVEGIVTELPVGSWITVLKSLRQSATTPEQALAQAAELSRPGYQAVVLDTNAFGNLKPGYFAIVIPGAKSAADVTATCKAIGIPQGDHCYPREIKG